MSNLKAKNVKLVDATVYQVENGTWYMELQYEYEDEFGVHRRYYPKVEFPFFCGKLPSRDELTISLFTNKVAVFRGNFLNPATGRIMHNVCIIDNLVKPAVPAHEMTIEEIEKKLGYKIKIVNKEI